MKQGTKRVKFWCKHCDNSMVSAGTKCKVCGKRSDKKFVKFDTNIILKQNNSNNE